MSYLAAIIAILLIIIIAGGSINFMKKKVTKSYDVDTKGIRDAIDEGIEDVTGGFVKRKK